MDATAEPTGNDGAPPPEADDGSADPSGTDFPDDRLWAIGGPTAESPDRIEPGNRHWRSILLLTVAANHLPDHERRRAAEKLVEDLFSAPVRQERKRLLEDRGATAEEIRENAVAFLLEHVWEKERGNANYSDLRDRIEDRLNDEISKRILGPDARKIWRSDEGDPPDRLDRILDARQDDEEDGTALPEELEVRAVALDALITRREFKRLLDRAEFGRGELQCWDYYELRGLSYEETADATGYTVGTVKAKVSRARGALEDAAEELTG